MNTLPCLETIRPNLAAVAACCSLAASMTLAVTSFWTALPENDALWNTSSYWTAGLPTAADDAYLNTANAFVRIDAGVTAQCRQLSVGRTTQNGYLLMTGGTLNASNEIFVGQYATAYGTFDMHGGVVSTASQLSVGAAGDGYLFMENAQITCGQRLNINRYPNGSNEGVLDAYGSRITALDLQIGSSGKLLMDDSTLVLTGDRKIKVESYVAGGQISHPWGGKTSIAYNGATNQTVVTASNGREKGLEVFPESVTGSRKIDYTYSGVRRLSAAPAPFTHPRVYMNPDEREAVIERINSTEAGREMKTMMRCLTYIFRKGSSAYLKLVSDEGLTAASRIMPNGQNRVDNVSLNDFSALYAQLIANNPSGLAALSDTQYNTLAGLFALEALDSYLFPEGSRGENLAAALKTWADWALAQPGFGTDTKENKRFGNHTLGLAYDFNYGSMNEEQIKSVRKALVNLMKGLIPSGSSASNYVFVGQAPESVAGNWTTLDTFRLILASSIEGEADAAGAGLTNRALESYFTNAMTTLHKFFTYGFYPTGAPYEGQGKNYTFGAHLIPLARRGYDFFGHPHIRAYMQKWLPAVMEPYGYGFQKFDVLGGNNLLMEMSDVVGAAWMYPEDAASQWSWRNSIRTPYTTASGEKASFYDARKLSYRSVYHSTLIPALLFATDAPEDKTWEQANQSVLGQLDHLDPNAGVLSARSGYGSQALRLLGHIRQDFGGHTSADRNSFTLAALGRTFIRHNNIQDSFYHSIVHVDDKAMKITEKEGRKMRIPASLAGWSITPQASFVSGDATYSYTWEWDWTASTVLKAGFEWETRTFNDFRRSNNKIVEPFGNTPFKDFPGWNSIGPEGVQKKPFNAMRQVYRTMGVVRGSGSYALIVDDVQKDAATHDYKWYATVEKDLAIVSASSLPGGIPAGYDSTRDVILKESAGNRCLLVRILKADGTPVQAAGSTGSPLAYLELFEGGSLSRLVIQRASVVAPGFRVLLYPFNAGEACPSGTVSGNTVTVKIGSQTDTLTFYPRTATVAGQSVSISDFTLTRGGSVIMNYRNILEPRPFR